MAIVAMVLTGLAMMAVSKPVGTVPGSQLLAVFQSALPVAVQVMVCPLPKGAMSVPPAPSGANWKSSMEDRSGKFRTADVLLPVSVSVA